MKRDIYYYDHYEKVKDINETLLDNCIELFEFLIKVEDEDFIEEHIIENEDGSKGIKFNNYQNLEFRDSDGDVVVAYGVKDILSDILFYVKDYDGEQDNDSDMEANDFIESTYEVYSLTYETLWQIYLSYFEE